jgi:glycosyltransferase involved in cell wall biosynthesis
VSKTGRPRALVFAYACEPERGSEPGAGWGVVRTLSEFAECVVLVGPEHGAALRRWETGESSPSLHFVEVSEPSWAKWAKSHRILWFLLYLVWLRRADAVGRQLHQENPFDAVCHATYSTYWLPSPATSYGVPSIWGPVGGAVTTPLALWPILGWRGIWDEILDRLSVRIMAALPATRRTWASASVHLVQNQATVARLPEPLRSRAIVLNHSLLADVHPSPPRARAPYCLYIGALESRKGPRLAIRALAHTPEGVRLVVVGDGPERRTLERLSRRLGVAHRLELRGARPRSEVQDLFSEAAAAVFTGLREEGGIALAEALAGGIPVIVLAHGGARVLAEAAPDPERIALIEPGGVDQTARQLAEAMTRFVREPSTRSTSNLDAERARRRFREVFMSTVTDAGRRERVTVP